MQGGSRRLREIPCVAQRREGEGRYKKPTQPRCTTISLMVRRLPCRSSRSSRRRRRRSYSLLTVSAVLINALTLDRAQALEARHQLQQQQRWWNTHEEDKAQQSLDPEEALRYGNHLLRSHGDRATALAQFDTLVSDSGFPAGDTLFLLGKAHDEGREDIGIKRDEAAARELYEYGAKLGHPGSQHALSVLLASSAEGGEVEAILYDFFASMGGDALAHAAMGYRYLYGIGTVQNCGLSVQHYLVAAKATIADLHSKGRGGIQRPVELTRLAERFVSGRQSMPDVDWVDVLRVSSSTGDVDSIRAMGILHLFGNREVEQNLEESYRLFSEGARKNDLFSTAYAGRMLMSGAGVEVDYEAALEHFNKSKRNPVSLTGLGYLYYHGLGVEQNIVQAYDYLKKAETEEKGIMPETLFSLGKILLGEKLVDENGRPTQISGSIEEGDDPIVLMQNLDVALTMFKAAAKAGHVDAAFHAALMYMEAEPFTIGHCKRAVMHLKSVVEKGPWMGGLRSGLKLALQGDYGGALVHYSRLAEIGSEVAQSNAAWLLESGHCGGSAFNGNGTRVGCEKRALRLYEHAARQGRPSAEMKVGDFHYRGKAGLPVDYEKAVQRYLKAANDKHAEALFGMGYMYQTGKGVAQDLPLAKRFFDEAAMSSVEAIPVVRISLVLLRLQWWWMDWRAWWRNANEEGKWLPRSETTILVVLTGMLSAVLLEQARRRNRRVRAQMNHAGDE